MLSHHIDASRCLLNAAGAYCLRVLEPSRRPEAVSDRGSPLYSAHADAGALPHAGPRPSTSWNGMFVKLHGIISVDSGDHVYGTVKVNYMDKNYWEEHPIAQYDTDEGGAYSLDVMANVPFKVDIGYLYVGRLPEVMNTRRLDRIYVIEEDTALDFEVMTSNITPKN